MRGERVYVLKCVGGRVPKRVVGLSVTAVGEGEGVRGERVCVRECAGVKL